MPKQPRSARPLSTSSGTHPSRSIASPSMWSRQKRSTCASQASARSFSAGSGAGGGQRRPMSKRPPNRARAKLRFCHSDSRAPSATSRASCSVASLLESFVCTAMTQRSVRGPSPLFTPGSYADSVPGARRENYGQAGGEPPSAVEGRPHESVDLLGPHHRILLAQVHQGAEVVVLEEDEGKEIRAL